MATTEKIPGAGLLGFGIDIVGSLEAKPKFAIFKSDVSQAKTYQDVTNGKTYLVPDNMDYFPVHVASVSSDAFSSRQQVQQALSLAAGVTGSFRAFTGEVDARYETAETSDRSNYYAITDFKFTSFNLHLRTEDTSVLESAFLNDPIVTSLPDSYTPATRPTFRTFFEKFGTHYVHSASVGGRLLYSIRVAQSFASSNEDVKAKASLEYSAVIGSVKATAEANWAKLTESWAASRSVRIRAIGGDPDTLSLAPPVFGDNQGPRFDKWLTSAKLNPAVMDFTLLPLSTVFDGAKRTALEAALNDYQNCTITLRANVHQNNGIFSDDWSIQQGPNKINPGVSGPFAASPFKVGVQIALFDPISFKLIFNKTYLLAGNMGNFLPDNNKNTVVQFYAGILNDLNQITTKGYLAAVVVFGVSPSTHFPSNDFMNWLVSVGGSIGLKNWRDQFGQSGANFSDSSNYLLVGFQGPGESIDLSSVRLSGFGDFVPENMVQDDRITFSYFDKLFHQA